MERAEVWGRRSKVRGKLGLVYLHKQKVINQLDLEKRSEFRRTVSYQTLELPFSV